MLGLARIFTVREKSSRHDPSISRSPTKINLISSIKSKTMTEGITHQPFFIVNPPWTICTYHHTHNTPPFILKLYATTTATLYLLLKNNCTTVLYCQQFSSMEREQVWAWSVIGTTVNIEIGLRTVCISCGRAFRGFKRRPHWALDSNSVYKCGGACLADPQQEIDGN